MGTLESFYKSICETGSYSSAPLGNIKPRAGLRAAWGFYVGTLGSVVNYGARKISQKDFSPDTYGELSWRMIDGTERIGGSVHFEGFENLSVIRERPAVIVANHMSLVETMLLPAGIFAQGRMVIVAKRSLTRYPFFGRILAASRPILVDRVNPRQDLAAVMEQGAQNLKEGSSVLLFPQGTRMTTFDPARFNSLGAKLAMRSKVPLIPVACKTDFSQPGKIMRDFGPIQPRLPIRFEAGAPLDTDKMNQKELQAAAIKHIVESLTKWDMPVVESDQLER